MPHAPAMTFRSSHPTTTWCERCLSPCTERCRSDSSGKFFYAFCVAHTPAWWRCKSGGALIGLAGICPKLCYRGVEFRNFCTQENDHAIICRAVELRFL